MKIVPILIFMVHFIFVKPEHSDLQSFDEQDIHNAEFPKTSSSSIEYYDEINKKDPEDAFWGHPIVNHSPRIEPAHHVGKPRYPIYDPSYPIWSPSKWNKKNYNKGYGKMDISLDTNESKELLFAMEPNSAKQTDADAEEHDPNKMDDGERKRYKEEIKAGDMTRLMGTNQHKYQPAVYNIFDLGRRFVLQYPYNDIKHNDVNGDEEDPSLIPKRAPPELVLAVAKEAEKKQAAKTVDPNEHIIKQESLRSGDYWNAFWKEDVDDPENALRSPKLSKLDTVFTKLSPGSPIYDYVVRLNKSHPKLLYVINKSKLN